MLLGTHAFDLDGCLVNIALGAEMSDYFNYGFDETSWNEYAARQKMMREMATNSKRVFI